MGVRLNFMTINDIQKEFRKEFYAYCTHDRLGKESFSDWADKFLRTTVEQAFEETKVKEKEQTVFRSWIEKPNCSDCGAKEAEYHKGECTKLKAVIFNQALAELKSRQDKFMGKE